MKYYKQVIDNEIVGYQSSEISLFSDILNEITEEEYNEAIEDIMAKNIELYQQEMQEEQSKDERIAALEEENAALLYKLLTGDDLE